MNIMNNFRYCALNINCIRKLHHIVISLYLYLACVIFTVSKISWKHSVLLHGGPQFSKSKKNLFLKLQQRKFIIVQVAKTDVYRTKINEFGHI